MKGALAQLLRSVGRVSALALAACTLAATPVRADYAVLARVEDGAELASPSLREGLVALDRAMAATSRGVVDATLLRMRLGAQGRFPAQVSADDEKDLAARVRLAWLLVARQKPQALDAVREVMELARDRIETLNRDDGMARRLFDTCLLVPRVLGEQGLGSFQLQVVEAVECRRLFPGVDALRTQHPPEVLAALAEADRKLAQLPLHPLDVTVTPAREGCTLYLNGRVFAPVPFHGKAMPGSYAAQVECDDEAPGTALVHDLQLTQAKASLAVAAPLEKVLRSGPEGLHFEARRNEDPDVEWAARALIDALGVGGVLLLTPRDGGLLLQLVARDHRQVITRDVDVPTMAARIDLLFADSDAASWDKLRLLAPDLPVGLMPGAPVRHRPVAPRRAWGFALFGVGAVTALSLGVVNRLAVPNTDGAQRSRLAVEGVGTATAVIGEALWMPAATRHPPWWAWLAAGVGAAQVAYGAWELAVDGDCAAPYDGPFCPRVRATHRAGVSNLLMGTIWLAFPAMHYLARWRTGPRMTLGVDARGAYRGVSWRGTF